MKTGFDPDEIEQRLHAMQPTEPGPAVRGRLAASLDGPVIGPSRAWYRRRPPAVAVAVMAAVLMLVALLSAIDWQMPEPRLADQPQPGPLPAPTQPPVPRDRERPTTPTPGPTLSELKKAWREAPEAFDTLLDQAGPPPHFRPSPDRTPALVAADVRRWALTEDLP